MSGAARTKGIAVVLGVVGSLSWSSAGLAAEPDRWGRWVAADEGYTPMDVRMGLHVSHVSLRDSSVGDGKHGRDYGFDRPAVYVPELTFSAFTAKHLSLGLLLQPVGFGGQDAPVSGDGSRYTRSPFVLGLGFVAEGAWSAGPILLRPGLATGPRAILLVEDRSGKQSPPAVGQWFLHARVAGEIELTRSLAVGVGASTDALRPLDWGGFAYLSWRFHDVAGATDAW